MSVSDARAYTAEGMTQMARSRQPGADASAFMARLIAMQATFSARAPDGAPAVQGQGDAECGEDQRADVGDAGFQGGDGRGVLDVADHDVLGVPAHRGRCRGEDGEGARRGAQPGLCPVVDAGRRRDP